MRNQDGLIYAVDIHFNPLSVNVAAVLSKYMPFAAIEWNRVPEWHTHYSWLDRDDKIAAIVQATLINFGFS